MFNDKREIEDVVSVSSNEEYLKLEELNYICSDVAESLGDGGCDPKCLKAPISHCRGTKKIKNKKNKISQDERNFLEL